MADLTAEEAQRLIAAIVSLVSMADRALPQQTPPLVRRVREHLDIDDAHMVPNTSVSFEPIERANLQLAFDHLHNTSAIWEEHGLAGDIGNYGGISLVTLMAGSWHGPMEAARQYLAVEISPTESIKCLRAGLVLTELDGVPVAVLLYQLERRGIELVLEVAAGTQEAADGFLARLRALMLANNVLRGKVLTFSFGEYGGFGLTFSSVPSVSRTEVIIPAWKLDAIDEHALGITRMGTELLAAGQHLKRGLLLYGPPGTGKTHTVSYLVSQSTERTTIILSGASVGAVGQAGSLARKLAPATIVIEDVDLIGMDRQMPGGEHNPLLFQLLNEMDGLQEDDDVLFVLTTNRADLLEPALAARPGRIDQAIEIGLPDADGRRALLRLYLKAPVEESVIEQAVVGTEGVAAAFIKEIARRAALRAIRSGVPVGAVLLEVIADLDATATPLLRAALAGSAPAGPAVFPDIGS